MFFNVFKSIILSGIFICIIHYIIYFFIETLTVPKVKDLINVSSKQQELLHSIQSKEVSNTSMQSLKTFLKSNNTEHANSNNVNPEPMKSSHFASSAPPSNIISFSDYE
jgi:hypothetical protein